MGFGLDIGGFFKKDKKKEKHETEFMTPEQQKLLKDLIGWVSPYVGKGATPYGGELPGTSGPSPLQTKLFGQMQGLKFGGPEEWKDRVKDYLGARREYLAPSWEEEESLLGTKMATMGLQHSTDMVKEMLDLKKTRTAEESMIGQQMYDTYERYATLELPQVMSEIGTMQRDIEESGLAAEFQEWLRTQPEYSPYFDLMLSLLGLRAIEEGEGKATGTSWGLSGGGSYQSK